MAEVATTLVGDVTTYLDEIVARHRAAAADDERPLHALRADAERAAPPRGFGAALARGERDELAVIAEIKRRSPSKGELAGDLVPGALAKAYADGGAACLSVLTDAAHFGGSADDLAEARRSCDLPVLRKDFTVSERDVYDARVMGADAILLIVAALDDVELKAFSELARELGLDALVEVNDEDELERALAAGATVVGVNQRDLRTFAVDAERAVRLGALMPAGVTAVAESGIGGRADAERVAAAGYRAVLVGEALVCSADPTAAVRELRVPCS